MDVQVRPAPDGSDTAMHPARRALAQLLVETGKLNVPGVERAERVAAESGEHLELVLARLGLVSEADIAAAFARLLDLPLAAAAHYPELPVLEETFSRRFLKTAQILPLAEREDGIAVAMVDPLDDYAADAIRFATGRSPLRHVACPTEFETAFERLYGDGRSEIRQISEETQNRKEEISSEDVERIADSASEAPVIRLVNLLIARAVEARASDIHIEPMDGELHVRFRIDGVLQEVESPPQRLSAAVISRVKIMAKLNISERRVAQDGRIRLAVRGKDIDFRVSTIPTIHGESVVLRILNRDSQQLDFAALGFDEPLIRAVRAVLERPHGIFLVTGPTGSGKTTTLYTGLHELNTAVRKILTIEDPVEYQMKGVNQVQVKPQIGLTFANVLRSFLRHDPDVIMVGEIRDLETAQVAVQAALTGHLILSTLHTNDAASALTRLLDMGIEDFLLTSTINGVLAQRLVRLLCRDCREAYRPLPEFLEKMGLPRAIDTLYHPRGCKACGHTGYAGRSSIVELLIPSDDIRKLVLQRAGADAILASATETGMQTMYAHGMSKALAGLTTIEEVVRVTRAV
ncbi:MAG TPA: type II secretion system ATPase GspE [Rhizomicrobium sp.]|jgi:general secretion pathway protein E